ncbi:MAG: TRAP transporter small permease subunit [Burkholderiaceae bacterium]
MVLAALTLDAAEFMLFLITFLGTPWVLREQGHIAIEIVVEKVGPRAGACWPRWPTAPAC